MLSVAAVENVRKKLVVCGDGAGTILVYKPVGKTYLLMVQSGLEFSDDYTPTIFDNYISKVPVGKKEVELSLWDTAGQEDYDRIRPLSYPDTDILIIAYSVMNWSSFSNVTEKWLPETKHFLPGTPRILVACKCDARDDPEWIEEMKNNNQKFVTFEEGQALANDIGAIEFFECSAKTGAGVQEIFQAAARIALKPPRKRINQKCKII